MIWIKRIAGLAAGILIFCVIAHGLNYIYVPTSEMRWERTLWHNFYEDKGKIDNLYIGSSHVYNGVNPFLLDSLNGKYNFNLASKGQLMNGTYYLLKEADKYNNLQHVYVDLYYWNNTKDNFNDNEQPIKMRAFRSWINTDFMKWSSNKLSYMLTMADAEQYPSVFLGFTRYRAELDNWELIKLTAEEKSREDYINFEYHCDLPDESGYDEYRKKGYIYSTNANRESDRIFEQGRILSENPIAETSEEYLRKVIAYCQKRSIPITLFVTPMYELQLISTENYDNYLNQLRGIAAEYNVDFYDFNLAKTEYLPIQDTKCFKNIGHLNYVGADMYTNFLHKVMTGDKEENKKYFYESYAQKLADTAPEAYGIYWRSNAPAEDGIVLRNMFIASNRKTGMEYRIIMTPDDGREQYMIQDFDENSTFQIGKDDHGVCTIIYRMQDAPDKVQTIEINY